MAFQNVVMECTGCGASITVDPTLRFGNCPYCGRCNSLVQSAKAAEQPVVEDIFPANFSEQAFRSAVRAFLCSKSDVPDSLYENMLEQELTLNFWPFYRQEVQWDATWTADIGYENENAKNGVAWQGSSGQTMGSTVIYTPASSVIHNRGLGGDSCRLALACDEMPLPFHPEHCRGISYLNCDTAAGDGEKAYVVPALDESVTDQCIEQLPGEYQRNLHTTRRIIERKTTLQMIPFWLFVYEWEGCSYYVMQNAASGAVAGTVPTTSRRKWIAAGLTAGGIAAVGIGAGILAAFQSKVDAVMFIVLTLPLVCAGIVYREQIAIRKSKIKLAPVGEIGKHLAKLKEFEQRFTTYSGLVMAGWAVVAFIVTALMPIVMPNLWYDAAEDRRYEPPVDKVEQLANSQKRKTYIKLRLKKIDGISEEIEDDSGNAFVIEK